MIPQVLELQSDEQTEFFLAVLMSRSFYGTSCLDRYKQYLSIVEQMISSGVFSEEEIPLVITWIRSQLLGINK